MYLELGLPAPWTGPLQQTLTLWDQDGMVEACQRSVTGLLLPAGCEQPQQPGSEAAWQSGCCTSTAAGCRLVYAATTRRPWTDSKHLCRAGRGANQSCQWPASRRLQLEYMPPQRALDLPLVEALESRRRGRGQLLCPPVAGLLLPAA